MTRKDIIDTEVRTPAENARTFLLTFCVGFTVLMIVCMILGSIFADEQAKQGIMYCWSLLGASVCRTRCASWLLAFACMWFSPYSPSP